MTAVATRPTLRRVPAELVLWAVVVLLLLLAALAPGLPAPYDPFEPVGDPFSAPSAAHLFGTDQVGRDLFSRVVHGASLTLGAAVTATLIALVAGGGLGALAGFARGGTDTVVGRFCDALLAVPGILLALALLAALGYGSMTAAVAVGVGSIPTFARLMRAETLRVCESVYVEAARAGGASASAVLRRHVIPNAAAPVVRLALLELGQAVLIIGALSYLGFGEPPPAPEWGSLIATGQTTLRTAWWLSILPGLVLALVVVAVNRIAHLVRGNR